uniref:Uncharacterized protein n=1 Tax=Cacopsylla melanoneura TaxID=428564 RepID=A0A8D8WXE5_9HEMI
MPQRLLLPNKSTMPQPLLLPNQNTLNQNKNITNPSPFHTPSIHPFLSTTASTTSHSISPTAQKAFLPPLSTLHTNNLIMKATTTQDSEITTIITRNGQPVSKLVRRLPNLP